LDLAVVIAIDPAIGGIGEDPLGTEDGLKRIHL
jgi:hypothetical protein